MKPETLSALASTLASFTIIASVALVADCSKQVARTGIEQAEDCGRRGGIWTQHDLAPERPGICIGAKK